jgi:hypothetical protein
MRCLTQLVRRPTIGLTHHAHQIHSIPKRIYTSTTYPSPTSWPNLMLWFSTAYGFAAGYHTSTLNHSTFDQPSLKQLSPEHQAALDAMSNKLTKLEQLQNSVFKKMERMILSQHKSIASKDDIIPKQDGRIREQRRRIRALEKRAEEEPGKDDIGNGEGEEGEGRW